MPLIKDLVVDMEPFFAKYRAVLPYLINDEIPASGERQQSQEARARFDDTTKCILCAACTTSCPSFWANEDYIGPAAIVQAHRFIFDDRDTAADLRLRVLNDVDGVWRCRTVFNCVQACPRDIDVTRAIGEVKLALMSWLRSAPSWKRRSGVDGEEIARGRRSARIQSGRTVSSNHARNRVARRGLGVSVSTSTSLSASAKASPLS